LLISDLSTDGNESQTKFATKDFKIPDEI